MVQEKRPSPEVVIRNRCTEVIHIPTAMLWNRSNGKRMGFVMWSGKTQIMISGLALGHGVASMWRLCLPSQEGIEANMWPAKAIPLYLQCVVYYI